MDLPLVLEPILFLLVHAKKDITADMMNKVKSWLNGLMGSLEKKFKEVTCIYKSH